MSEIVDRIQQANLVANAGQVLAFVDGADPCFLGGLVLVLIFLGSRMVAGQPAVQGWGLRLAVLTFLGYGGYLWFTDPPAPGAFPWLLLIRVSCVAGAVLAVAWIVLPVCSFVLSHMRLLVAAFLGGAGYSLITLPGDLSSRWSELLLRGALFATLALVIAWILAPVWAFLANMLPRRTPRSAEPEAPAPRRRATVVRSSSLSEVLEQGEAGANRDREGQRRRDRARLQVELAYMQSLPAVAAWFPRKLLDDFVARHLADHVSPEEVEDNARELLQVLRQHQPQEHAPVSERFATLEELGYWLLDEQQRIQALAVDAPLKQTQLLDLHQRYLLLATRMVHRQTALTN